MKKAILFWKNLFTRPDFWPLLFVVVSAFLASRHLFTPGYFNMHDDLQMMRQLQIEKCFLDGQIPCRWVPDMGFGYGFPLFNFYPPLPYYIGELFRVIGFSFVDTAKILFIIAFFGSGITMYYFAKQFFGKFGGMVAGIFYIWAPYHSVDVYVRGALNEAWALIWFPAILLAGYKLISATSVKSILRCVILLAFTWAALLTSHNLMVLIFAPVFAVWCLLWLAKTRDLRKIIYLLISGILSFGLAAFFTLPVFLEQKLVHASTLVQGYFEYTAHFATIKQLLWNRFWGYGPSVWMDADDKMSFQIGEIYWIGALFVTLLVGYKIIKGLRKKNPSGEIFTYLTIALFVLVGWIAAFMAHSKSIYIWQAIEPIKFVQFPWRFLTLVIFSFSFVLGSIVFLIKAGWAKILMGILCIFIIVFNWAYFRPQGDKMGPLTDEQKFTGAAWDLQRTAGIYDYLPLTAKQNPRDGQNVLAEIMEGEGKVTKPDQGTNWFRFNVEATEPVRVRIGIYQFPEWKVEIDNNEVEEYVAEDEMWGRMYVDVPAGEHVIYGKLYDTQVRTIGNIISVVSWIGLVGFVVWKRKEIF